MTTGQLTEHVAQLAFALRALFWGIFFTTTATSESQLYHLLGVIVGIGRNENRTNF
jgi:hypothetical protein